MLSIYWRILTVVFLMPSAGLSLMAQKSDLFTYDRQEVNSAMEQINESTAQPGFLHYLGDTTKVDQTSNFGYFLIGFIPGCLAPPAGCFVLSFLFNSYNYQQLQPIIGGTLGWIVPAGIVGIGSRDWKKVGYTSLGGFVGAGVSVISIYLLVDFMGGW